jgi:hypothetical protein
MAAMFKCPHCDDYFTRNDGAQLHIFEVHELLDLPIICQVLNSGVPELEFQQTHKLTDENLRVDWDFDIDEETKKSNALTSLTDPMLNALPASTMFSSTLASDGPQISYGYDSPPNLIQQNMESGHGGNSVSTSWNEQKFKQLEPTEDVEKWAELCLTKIQSNESISTKQNALVCT